MEIFGILIFGTLFVCTAGLWLKFCLRRKLRWYKALIGFAVIGLPASFGVICMSIYMFIDEPLYMAASNGDIAKVQTLLNLRANPNVDFEGTPALYSAAKEGHTEVVRLLLAHKADVNAKDDWTGNTPLQTAQKNGHKDIVILLKKAGATQ